VETPVPVRKKMRRGLAKNHLKAKKETAAPEVAQVEEKQEVSAPVPTPAVAKPMSPEQKKTSGSLASSAADTNNSPPSQANPAQQEPPVALPTKTAPEMPVTETEPSTLQSQIKGLLANPIALGAAGIALVGALAGMFMSRRKNKY
jgi:outer membrane biosynthesis protein TonB